MNSEEAELIMWSLPRLFNYSNVKQLTDVLDEVDLMETIIMSGAKEFLLTIKFTGRKRAVMMADRGAGMTVLDCDVSSRGLNGKAK